jgi:hypothetical protein
MSINNEPPNLKEFIDGLSVWCEQAITMSASTVRRARNAQNKLLMTERLLRVFARFM